MDRDTAVVLQTRGNYADLAMNLGVTLGGRRTN